MKFAITSFDKAITAAVLAAASMLTKASIDHGTLTEADYISAAVAGVIAGLAVYLKANAPGTSAPTTKPAA